MTQSNYPWRMTKKPPKFGEHVSKNSGCLIRSIDTKELQDVKL